MSERRLRILHVVRQFSPSIGGLEAYVQQLASLQADEWDVDILTLNRVFGDAARLPPQETMGALKVIRIPFIGYRRLFLPILRPALLEGYDVIHIHAADQLLDLIAALSRFRAMRLFMTTHGLFFHTDTLARAKEIYLKTITRASLKRMDQVFAVSANDANTLKGVGIDAEVLRNPIVPIGDFLCEGQDLLYVGRLSTNKRIDSLIAFMAALGETCGDLKLHIVGSDQENLWPGLSEKVKRQGIDDRILYHGYMAPNDMAALARSCGFAVSASRYEGFGLAVIEGMSVGLLPVMHANDAFKETYERSHCGLLTDFDDPALAAQDFAAWASDVTKADREKAQAFANSQSWDSVVKVYRRYYEQD